MEIQEAELRVFINDEGEMIAHSDITKIYLTFLNELKTDIEKNLERTYLLYTSIILSNSAVEYLLNHTYEVFSFRKYGINKNGGYIKGFETFSLNSKLLFLPELISEGQLMWDTESTLYQILFQLIKFRNKVIHSNQSSGRIKKFEDSPNNRIEDFPQGEIHKLSSDQCISYINAVIKFATLLDDFKSEIKFEVNEFFIRAPSAYYNT
jgi:hypothetical protein